MTIVDTTPVRLTAPVNLRDLGGIPVGEHVVRRGFAVRADDLAIVTPEAADRLIADGVTAVIDLRSVDEVTLTGRGPFGERPTVSYHHVPLMADLSLAGSSSEPFDQRRFGGMYVGLVENAAPRIVQALAIIAYSPGAVAFHCAAGQDRTGVLAASLLLALGADHDAVVADYVRTRDNSAAIMQRISPLIEPLLARHGLSIDGAARAALRTEFSEEPMRDLVATLTERHGDPLAPLRRAGLTDGLIARLRERGLERA